MTLTLKIDGMSCGHCVARVKNALESTRGIKKANVNLDEGVAVVDYDESRANRQQMEQAVRVAGYQVKEVVS
jgi:copper chaperone